ncbi:MAG: double-cubane-cluster-containing anaerobic reductase [Candidatus Woesearchaeota archaeon]
MIKRIASLLNSDEEAVEFEKRYLVRRPKPRKEELFDRYMSSNKHVIAALKSRSRPMGMEEFDSIFITNDRVKELEKHKKSGRKIIGTFCNMVPLELIYAAGAIPVRLCSGCKDAIKAGEEIFPKDSCNLIKSSIGNIMQDQPYSSLCDAVVIPATCDGKKKMGEILNEYKAVWVMELPQTKDRMLGRKNWLSETHILKRRIERLTKTIINRKNLEKAIRLTHNRHDVVRRFLHIRKEKPWVISGSDSLLVMQASFFDDIEKWTGKAERLCQELEMSKQEKNPIRILVTGSPIIIPNFKIPLTIEHFNAVITADETCAGIQYLYDPVEPDEWNMSEMLKAVSERYLMPSVCPCFIKAEDRIDKLLDMIKLYNVEGVIYHNLRLCLLFDAESAKVRRVLEQKGVPFLYINTDYSKEDTGQLKTRIEAFIEILESRR